MSEGSVSRPVLPGDRVNDVLARDESLVEVFIRHSAHFAKLRNRAMRKVMGRLVTVDAAARIAEVPGDALVRDLNTALGIAAHDVTAELAVNTSTESERRSARSHRTDAPIVEVDVRDDLREGREPLARIMGVAGALGDGEVLRVRAIFQPVPLLAVLGRKGFLSESEQHAPDDWSVWFWRGDVGATSIAPEVAVETTAGIASGPVTTISDGNTVWLDVRGLQPPEPLVRTLAALESLGDGLQLIQINERVPQLLLPMLAERGFACELDDSRADRVLVRIWRPA